MNQKVQLLIKGEYADFNKEKLQINQKYCFDNYEDLLNCNDVDIVYIALPNSLHHEWINKCIENKKNISNGV